MQIRSPFHWLQSLRVPSRRTTLAARAVRQHAACRSAEQRRLPTAGVRLHAAGHQLIVKNLDNAEYLEKHFRRFDNYWGSKWYVTYVDEQRKLDASSIKIIYCLLSYY